MGINGKANGYTRDRRTWTTRAKLIPDTRIPEPGEIPNAGNDTDTANLQRPTSGYDRPGRKGNGGRSRRGEEEVRFAKMVKPPSPKKYTGNASLEVLEVFVSQALRFFQLGGTLRSQFTAQQVTLLGTMMEGDALEWYNIHGRMRSNTTEPMDTDDGIQRTTMTVHIGT